MDGIVTRGVKEHPGLGGAARQFEVLSLFLGSDADMRSLALEANQLAALLVGAKAASFWMLWPADWEADWHAELYGGFVERRAMFKAMRAWQALEVTFSPIGAGEAPAVLVNLT